MKKKALIGLVILSAVAMYGCSSIGVKPQPGAGQSTFFSAGTEAIVSGGRSTIALRPEKPAFPAAEKPTFILTAINGQNFSVIISTENISAQLNGTPVRVYTYAELVKEVETAAAIQAFGAAMASVGRSMSAANAGHQYHYGYAPYGSPYATTYYTYDAAAAQQARTAAQAQTDADFYRLQTETEAALAALESTILRKQTVFPGEGYGGYIKLEPISLAEGENTLTVSVEFGGETEEFMFELTEVEN